MSFHLVEQPSRLPQMPLWRNVYRAEDVNRDLVEIHRENPGASPEEALEIMAASGGWLY